jgi:hypothetical protein
VSCGLIRGSWTEIFGGNIFMDSGTYEQTEQAEHDGLLPLPIREPDLMLEVRPVEAMRDVDLLKRVKEGLERLG